MKWIPRQLPVDARMLSLKAALSTKAGAFPTPLANILIQRGINDLEEAKAFFKPDRKDLNDPLRIKGMRAAVDRIAAAVTNGEKIVLYGDYDVDGTTSVSLLTLFFEDWEVETSYYIPDRYTEGYGLSYQGIDHAVASGAGLMIALDCGTKALGKARYAEGQGLDLIIVDHHTPGKELPACVAFLNPRQNGCDYPFKSLPACGLAMKLAEAVEDRFKQVVFPDHEGFMYDVFDTYADLVTLSIACDIVPLEGENRIIAWHGVQKLRTAPLPGIAALMRLAEGQRKWDVSDLVFFIGPRINSAGRLKTARYAVRVLLGQDVDLEAFAADLHDYNAERKVLDKEITENALKKIESETEKRYTTVLYDESWHKGVIGIVASRLIERHYRPTILLTKSNGKWVGSGRSVVDFDLYDALEACSEHLVQFGGHKYAAGLTLEESALEPFKAAFEAYVHRNIQPESTEPQIDIAHELKFAEIEPRLIRLLKRLAPFGPANPEPVFETHNVKVRDCRILKEEHVRFALEQDGIRYEAIGFGLAYKWAKINALSLDIAFQPDFKTYLGKTSIQLRLKDFRAAQP